MIAIFHQWNKMRIWRTNLIVILSRPLFRINIIHLSDQVEQDDSAISESVIGRLSPILISHWSMLKAFLALSSGQPEYEKQPQSGEFKATDANCDDSQPKISSCKFQVFGVIEFTETWPLIGHWSTFQGTHWLIILTRSFL